MKKLLFCVAVGMIALAGCQKTVDGGKPEYDLHYIREYHIDNQSGSEIVIDRSLFAPTIADKEKKEFKYHEFGLYEDHRLPLPDNAEFDLKKELWSPTISNFVIKVGDKTLPDKVWELDYWDFFSEENTQREWPGEDIDGNPNTHIKTYDQRFVYTLTVDAALLAELASAE